jgi:hypothetical protein
MATERTLITDSPEAVVVKKLDFPNPSGPPITIEEGSSVTFASLEVSPGALAVYVTTPLFASPWT